MLERPPVDHVRDPGVLDGVVRVLLHGLAKEEVRKEPQGDHAGGAAPDRDGIDDLGGGHEDVGDAEVLVEAS